MLEEPAPEVAGLQITIGVERMNHPHLVTGPACGDVEPPLLVITVIEDEWPILTWRVDHREKHHIALVTLKVWRASADEPSLFVNSWVEKFLKETVDFFGLRVSQKANDAKGEAVVV